MRAEAHHVEDGEGAPRREHAGDLGEEPRLVGNVHADVEEHRKIEGSLRERQVEGAADDEIDGQADDLGQAACGLDEVGRELDPGHARTIASGDGPGRAADA
jgi:hypothetical protein